MTADEEPGTPPVRRRDLRKGTRPDARRGRLLVLLVALTVVIAAADQATKYLAEGLLAEGEIIPLVGDLLGLQLIHNPGAAFSIATGLTWVLTVVAVVVVVAVLRISRKLGSTTWAVALGMLLGGCLGNLYDRLFREPGFGRGHVVDFINYNGWFVGNVADIAIVGAAVLIALLALLGREIDGTRVGEDETASSDPEGVAPGEDGDPDPSEADDVASGEVDDEPSESDDAAPGDAGDEPEPDGGADPDDEPERGPGSEPARA